MSLEEHNINFEYIKGIKNTLADGISTSVHMNPGSKLEPEPEGFEFGELKVDDEEMKEVEVQGGMKTSTGEKLHNGKFKNNSERG